MVKIVRPRGALSEGRSRPRAVAARPMMEPFDSETLLGYYHDLAKWHGFIRFVGLPQLGGDPDLRLAALYVEPVLSPSPIHLDQDLENWPGRVESVLVALAAAPRLVVLGDPGSGKSTLVSWICLRLTQSAAGRWRETLGPLVPLPLVLRELEIDAEINWDRLIDSFFNHPVAARLRAFPRQQRQQLFASGQAFLLLDGLDEIGNLEVRRALRAAVWEGARKFPRCRFLLTSRLVGYDQVPFHLPPGEKVSSRRGRGVTGIDYASGAHPYLWGRPETPWAELRYVAPFSDRQIEQFAHNWYSQREAVEALRETGARDLLEAIRRSPVTTRLARGPILLTLMALIHRVQRRLPHGRALLFEKIAEAYLETIDTFRGIQELSYTLHEKKLLLGFIAFQMQLRRSAAVTSNEHGKDFARDEEGGDLAREVLVDHETVLRWVEKAMLDMGKGADAKAARRFIDYLGRRSGLLLPRGDGMFAFTHLSFQEYFGAVYLAEQLTSPGWQNDLTSEGTKPQDLECYAGRMEWQETLLLLFELFAERPKWLKVLRDRLFGKEYEGLRTPGAPQLQVNKKGVAVTVPGRARAELLAKIAVDPHSGLGQGEKQAAWKACLRWEIASRQVILGEHWFPQIMHTLLAVEGEEQEAMWRCVAQVVGDLRPARLSFAGCQELKSINFLDGGDFLLALEIQFTAVRDLTPLRGHVKLRHLDLSVTPVSDLELIGSLRSLSSLFLDLADIDDLTALSSCVELKTLSFQSTKISSLEPLRNLRSLREIKLGGTEVSDLMPLGGLRRLTRLFLSGTKVVDLQPLHDLRALRVLILNDIVGLRSIAPLSSCKSLRLLAISHSPVADEEIAALQATLPKLEIVRLSDE